MAEEEEKGGARDENSGGRREGREREEEENGKGDRKIGKNEGRVGMAQDSSRNRNMQDKWKN